MINFDNNSLHLKEATAIILKRLSFDTNAEITVEKGDNPSASLKDGKGKITYVTDASYCRMLTLFTKEYSKGKDFEIIETINFDLCGPMLDFSRNGILKVEKVKEYIEYIAMMGLNRLVLYLEDMYEMKDYPYFGYMRGRYTVEELKAIDDYGAKFGIEVFPAIQTLGHMERYLHWDEGLEVKDTFNCLMAEEEKTYEFIENMIKTLAPCFRCRKIHVGMDEAHDFGLGKYLTQKGYRDRSELMLYHVNRVIEIGRKYGVELAMWSDMFFKLASKDGTYSDKDMDDNARNLIPRDIKLVYWSYNGETVESYDGMMASHLKMSPNISYAGGPASYFGFTCDTYNSNKLTQAVLDSAKKNGIKDIYATLWMDDGAECDFFLTLAAVELYAENMYGCENLMDKTVENFEYITKANYNVFMDMSQFHNIFDGRDYGPYWLRYNGKKILYQDILSGLCDEKLSENPLAKHYKHYAEKFNSYIDEKSLWNDYYVYLKALFEAMALKAEIGENIRGAYLEGNKEYLASLVNGKLDELICKMEVLKKLRLEMWYKNNKPFGGEVIDIRLSGVIARCTTAKMRLSQYLNGEVSAIEELEEARLPFSTYHSGRYSYIASVNIM